MKRLDQFLMDEGLARSRSQAKELIEASCVELNGELCNKASQKVEEGSSVMVLENDFGKYVSRAGLKLEGALSRQALSVKGFKVLDIGLSTGGFSDCLLQKGAQEILGIDVGHGQLAEELITNSRLKSFEGINAKDLSQMTQFRDFFSETDLIVMDVSFISITKILPELKNCGFKKGVKLLSLVKPQFELTKKDLNKQGLVKEESQYLDIKENIIFTLKNEGFTVEDYFESSIKGGDGNKEFFVYAKANF